MLFYGVSVFTCTKTLIMLVGRNKLIKIDPRKPNQFINNIYNYWQ